MNILMLTPAYGKGGAATTQHWTELGEHLSKEHHVTVTSAYPIVSSSESTRSGVKIITVADKLLSKIRNRHLWEAMLWVCMAFHVFFLPGRYDLVICVDTPRFATLIAYLKKLMARSRIIIWVMDLPLEQVVRRGDAVKKRSLLAKVSNRLYYHSLKLSDRIVVIGSCMRDLLAGRGVPQQKISVIGPWSDDSTGQMRMGASDARQQNDLPDLFTVMYLGYAGAWHEFDPILAAIPEIIKSHPIQFVFIGLGPGIERVAAEKAKNCWDQVIIKDWVPRDMLRVLPSCGDIHLVSLKENMVGTCSPSKTYSSMAFERPVIFLGPPSCQAAIDIKKAQAGEVVGNKDELINAIKKLFADRELLKSYGKNSRDAFLNKHSASVNLALWDAVLS
jgi:glycosyltransferase involved in cell wall biosynthesis